MLQRALGEMAQEWEFLFLLPEVGHLSRSFHATKYSLAHRLFLSLSLSTIVVQSQGPIGTGAHGDLPTKPRRPQKKTQSRTYEHKSNFKLKPKLFSLAFDPRNKSRPSIQCPSTGNGIQSQDVFHLGLVYLLVLQPDPNLGVLSGDPFLSNLEK